ncbi:MAG: hypothetical protein KF894_18130 [Labilithrix sp.]|nr:hypothetical protein [Labilithrix sp.]
MTSFTCRNCGAALDLPHDESALDARCAFCGKRTPLPQEILTARLRKNDDGKSVVVVAPSAPGVTLMVTAGAGLGLVLIAAVVFTVVRGGSPSRAGTAEPAPTAPPATAPPTAEPPAKRPTGREVADARLDALRARGCGEILLAPSETSGEQTIETKFALNGRCVAVLAVSGEPDNALQLTMRTARGARIETPPPSAQIELTYCPVVAGVHPTHISPKTDGTYTVAAVECPKSAAAGQGKR